MNSTFGTLVFREISDNPDPASKRLTISFLALEGKGLLVPCIRRQRFTRIVKAPKRISSVPFGVRKPELMFRSCANLCIPRRKPLPV